MTVRSLPDDLKGLLASATAGVTTSVLFSIASPSAYWDSSWLNNLIAFGAFVGVAAPVSLVVAFALGWPLYLLLTRLFGAVRWWWPILGGCGVGTLISALFGSTSTPVFVAIGAAAGFAFWLTLKAIEGDHRSQG